jgi:hypothetical protein
MRRKSVAMSKWNLYIRFGKLGERRMQRERNDVDKDGKPEREVIPRLWHDYKQRVVVGRRRKQMEVIYQLS